MIHTHERQEAPVNCPYSDCLVPRCTITIHPDRPNVEYCRVCGEWRYLDHIGDEFPNVFWLAFGIAIVLLIFKSLLSGAEQPAPLNPPQSGYSRPVIDRWQ